MGIALFTGLFAGFLAWGANPALGEVERMNGFDLEDATIPRSEIHYGGLPRDAIPAIDSPYFESVDQAEAFLLADDLVLSLEWRGEVRAYPTRILDYHEIVNDVIDGDALVITFCPLCGTGMVFKRKIGGRTLDFGVSGLLYQSDVLLYDRQSESLWSQIGRQAISGPLAGQPLELVASQMLRWSAWRELQPGGRVLSRRTGHRRPYGRSPYDGYEKAPEPMFPVTRHRNDLPAKTWVYGVSWRGGAKAYPEAVLPDRVAFSDTLGGRSVEIQFERESLAFRVVGVVDGGERQEIPHTRAFWFAWQAFHPETELFRGLVTETPRGRKDE